MKSQILALVGLMCSTIIGLPNLSAQITNEVDARIPFKFTVENTVLTPGQYTIRRGDEMDPTEMVIRSKDGHASVVFLVNAAKAESTPSRTELVFKKYGNREFLDQIFIEGNPDGVEVVKSRTEKKLESSEATPKVHRHPAHYRRHK